MALRVDAVWALRSAWRAHAEQRFVLQRICDDRRALVYLLILLLSKI